MEPLGGIEPPTFALPRRRYTPKPQWQWGAIGGLDLTTADSTVRRACEMQQAQVKDIARRLTCRDRIARYCA